jgi:aromatic ring-cleaving dioxygenase
MSNKKRPVNIHQHYHAHLYFDAETLEFATNLGQQIANNFALTVGRVHQKLVGPHTKWSCQILFSTQHFEQLIPWLEIHRNGLSILVHADTGDNLADHTKYAYWLGNPADIDLSIFKK